MTHSEKNSLNSKREFLKTSALSVPSFSKIGEPFIHKFSEISTFIQKFSEISTLKSNFLMLENCDVTIFVYKKNYPTSALSVPSFTKIGKPFYTQIFQNFDFKIEFSHA